VAELDDRVALRDLVERYALGVDRRAAAEVAALFEPEGVLVVPVAPRSLGPTVERRGRAAIEEAMQALARYAATFHSVVGHVVDLDQDTATGTTSCVARHVMAGDGGDTDTVWMLRYHDDYRRGAEGWRFTRRELTVEWIEEHAVRQVRGIG
jgi:hypothetical protein